jgi:hypothetical protein
MSRRHHGGRPHRSNAPGRPIDTSRPLGPVRPAEGPPAANPFAADGRLDARGPAAQTADQPERQHVASPGVPDAGAAFLASEPESTRVGPVAPVATLPDRDDGEPPSRPVGPNNGPSDHAGALLAQGADRSMLNGPRPGNGHGMGMGGACTAPQLRRFIKSRPYVPMHELRRRFAIDGGEDDVTAVDLTTGRIYVGLPSREGSLLGELLRGGEVGYELSLDPRSPIVVGLYPMRPVARG